jgi:hypothetical protein
VFRGRPLAAISSSDIDAAAVAKTFGGRAAEAGHS